MAPSLVLICVCTVPASDTGGKYGALASEPLVVFVLLPHAVSASATRISGDSLSTDFIFLLLLSRCNKGDGE